MFIYMKLCIRHISLIYYYRNIIEWKKIISIIILCHYRIIFLFIII